MTALRQLIGALRGQPVFLVIVLLNVAFIAAGAWLLDRREAQRHQVDLALIERCGPR